MTGMHAPLREPRKLYIDGQWIAPSSDATIDVISPATEELYLTVANAQADDVNRAVAAARQAFDSGPWPRMTHAERASRMNALADELANRADDIASIWPSEMGILYSAAKAVAPGDARP